ncbi:MAG: cell wall-binding repeat-containing protein, partial [Eubacteriales bacterium]
MDSWKKTGIRYRLLSVFTAVFLILNYCVTPIMAFGEEQSSDFERIAGSDRFETAVNISQEGWTSSETVILAAGMDENLVDSLTAGPLAKLYDAPILLTAGSSLPSKTEDELKRLGVKKAYITSGTSVISENVLNSVKALGIEIVNLGGKDRFETAVNIAQQFNNTRQIFVTTAYSNADALSVASIAANKESPILLVSKSSLPANVSTYLDTIKEDISNTYVIGGEGVISDTVMDFFPNAERVYGSDRYATNIEVLKKFKTTFNYGKVYIA